MVCGVHQGMLGPDVSVAPPLAVNEVQYLQHPPPDPHRVAGIKTGGEPVIQCGEAAPESSGVPQHQALFAWATFHQALRHHFRQELREVGPGAVGIQPLQLPGHVRLARIERCRLGSGGKFDRGQQRQRVEAPRQVNLRDIPRAQVLE